MNYYQLLQQRWGSGPLAPWGALLTEQVAAGLSVERYGDMPRWQAALDSLPRLEVTAVDLNSDRVGVHTSLSTARLASTGLEQGLRSMHPWRKGPFEIGGLHIDSEWRSDRKWRRLQPHIEPLEGRRVLDVGCGNGYHCWRMRGQGAREVVGIDPSPLFSVQFLALQRYIQDEAVNVLPVGIEAVPPGLKAFDTVFSMGVLYHRRSPMDHLHTLRECLRPGGQLVLETLVIEGGENSCLVPQGRYARMGNVWFLPSSAMLLLWLRKLGWKNPRVVNEHRTTTEEQRSTSWMTFQSLAHFLDPTDHNRTIEGYPGPRRAIILAEAPETRRTRPRAYDGEESPEAIAERISWEVRA